MSDGAPAPATGAPDGLALTPRQGRLAMALLLLFFLAWDLRAVLIDQRMLPSDSMLECGAWMLMDIESGAGWWSWVAEARKGPLGGMLVGLASLLPLDLLLSIRLLTVLLHGLLLWMVCRLARSLSGRWSAGLAALVVCGVFPGVYGWFRLEVHEVLSTTALLPALWLLLGPLNRPWRALLLGLLAGLAVLGKSSSPIFLAGPGLALLAYSLRRPRELALVALAAGTAVAVMGWWVVRIWSILPEYLQMSSQRVSEPLSLKILEYAFAIPGTLPLLLGALLSAVIVWRRRLVASRAVLGLTACIVVSYGLLLLFDGWSRYPLPVFPVAALLSGLGLSGLADWLHARSAPGVTRVTAALLGVALLGAFCWDNLHGFPETRHAPMRQFGAGMVAPDPRPYRAYPNYVDYVRRHRLTVTRMLQNDYPPGMSFTHMFFAYRWEHLGYTLDDLSWEQALSRIRAGEAVYLPLSVRRERPLRLLQTAEWMDGISFSEFSRRAAPHTAGWSKKLVEAFPQNDGWGVALIRWGPRGRSY